MINDPKLSIFSVIFVISNFKGLFLQRSEKITAHHIWYFVRNGKYFKHRFKMSKY